MNNNDKPQMSIDERLQFLLHSTESLHASCAQLHAIVAEHSRQMEATDARQKAANIKFNNLRLALLNGIRGFLEEPTNGEEPEEQL